MRKRESAARGGDRGFPFLERGHVIAGWGSDMSRLVEHMLSLDSAIG